MNYTFILSSKIIIGEHLFTVKILYIHKGTPAVGQWWGGLFPAFIEQGVHIFNAIRTLLSIPLTYVDRNVLFSQVLAIPRSPPPCWSEYSSNRPYPHPNDRLESLSPRLHLVSNDLSPQSF